MPAPADLPDAATIPLGDATRRFLEGAAAGQRLREAHDPATAGQPVPLRRELFCFYAGVLAAVDYGCTEPEEFTQFLTGPATRIPSVADDTEVDVEVGA